MNRTMNNVRHRGCSLPELLLTAALLTVLAGMSFGSAVQALARQRLEGATRRLGQGLEQARAMAEQRGEPCAIRLLANGWNAPAGGLPSCLPAEQLDGELTHDDSVALRHNLPEPVRISANGLPIDGGTLVVQAAGVSQQRCLVLALPLGVVRSGRYTGPSNGAVNSSACLPDRGGPGS